MRCERSCRAECTGRRVKLLAEWLPGAEEVVVLPGAESVGAGAAVGRGGLFQ